MPQESQLISQLSLPELERGCRRETERYRRTGSSDPHFCWEIFRRALQQPASAAVATARSMGAPESADGAGLRLSAVIEYDEDARTALVQIYTGFIKAHINPSAVASSSLDDMVQQVWLRFWRAARHGLNFSSLEAALSYLRQTVVSTLIEAQRQARKQQRDLSLQQLLETAPDAMPHDTAGSLFDHHAQQRFRARCREILKNELEYRIFWMRYSVGLPPREIARELARAGVQINQRPPTASAVSDMLDRSFQRLRTDPEIHDLLRTD
jgi:RNA polymerase sigma factor (sigma-70 family)